MAKKRPIKRTPPERRVDVTRLEYERLCEALERNAEAIKRLQLADEIQLRRTAEVQADIERLKGLLISVPKRT
jgi:hypothetical protein